jgi:hypothetical protein
MYKTPCFAFVATLGSRLVQVVARIVKIRTIEFKLGFLPVELQTMIDFCRRQKRTWQLLDSVTLH